MVIIFCIFNIIILFISFNAEFYHFSFFISDLNIFLAITVIFKRYIALLCNPKIDKVLKIFRFIMFILNSLLVLVYVTVLVQFYLAGSRGGGGMAWALMVSPSFYTPYISAWYTYQLYKNREVPLMDIGDNNRL